MKNQILVVVLAVVCIIYLGCTGVATNRSLGFDAYEGTYFFDSLNDTEKLREDHYIVLESKDGKFLGYYYGTTDDFDSAREGYYPGFFVSEMNNLEMKEGTISFSLRLFSNDIYSNPVALDFKSTDAAKEKNEPWLNAQLFDADAGLMKAYSGTIENGEIILITDDELRVFKKIKS